MTDSQRSVRRASETAFETLEQRVLLSVTYDFTHVADTTMQAPGQAWKMTSFYAPDVSSDGHSVFYANDGASNSGIFTDVSGVLECVAATGEQPAGIDEPILGVSTEAQISGQTILYTAYGADAANPSLNRSWVIKDVAGQQSVVLDTTMTIPKWTGKVTHFQGVENCLLLGNTAVVAGSWFSDDGTNEIGYYTDGGTTGGTLSTIIQSPLSDPATGDPLIPAGGEIGYDGTHLTFMGNTFPTDPSARKTEFFSTAGGPHAVFDEEEAPLPGNGNPFHQFGGGYGIDGSTIAFGASNDAGLGAIFSVTPNGQATRLVDTNTAKPGGGKFSNMSLTVGISNGDILFDSGNDTDGRDIYRSFNGAFSKVLASGDMLDGKNVTSAEFRPGGINGDELAVSVTFSDGTYGIYEAPAVRGSDQIVPVEPDSTSPGASIFNGAPTDAWMDTPLAQSLTFNASAGSAFAGIVELPSGYGSAFQVSVGGKSVGTFAAGASVSFLIAASASGLELSPQSSAPGISSFTITGINATIKPTGAKGFPIDLGFTASNAGFAATSGSSSQVGSISGTIFNDANSNAKQDGSEAGIAGVEVYNDTNNNGKLDSGEPTTVTDSHGNYIFTDLIAGNYKTRQILPTGWRQTTPANNYGWTLALSANQSLTGKNFGEQAIVAPPIGASIRGTVFNDTNGNGTQNTGETGRAGIVIYNDANNNGKLDSPEVTTTTDANGSYVLSGLAAGRYKIRQIVPAGWKQTTPSNNYGWTITLAANQSLMGKNFGEQVATAPPPPTSGSISGTVFNDANGDLKQDNGELGLSGWTVFIDTNNDGILDDGEMSTLTKSDGSYSFSVLAAGNYIIRAIRPTGWSQTTPTKNYGQHVTIAKNQNTTGVLFGERQIG